MIDLRGIGFFIGLGFGALCGVFVAPILFLFFWAAVSLFAGLVAASIVFALCLIVGAVWGVIDEG